jgi:hypothetical protein
MKVQLGMALAAVMALACSSGNRSTRTAANDTGTTQSGSISGTQGTAAGANGTQGTATTDAAGTTNQPSSGTVATVPSDTNSQGTTPPSSGTSGTVSSSGSSAPSTSDSTAGSSGSTVGSSGSTYGSAGSTAAGGTVSGSSSDKSSLKTVTGAVAKVDENSITLDQSAGGVTLTVDSQTQIMRRGHPVSSGITSIREGEQVRASFDPASNRADKIEVMGKAKMKHHKSAADAPPVNPAGK